MNHDSEDERTNNYMERFFEVVSGAKNSVGGIPRSVYGRYAGPNSSSNYTREKDFYTALEIGAAALSVYCSNNGNLPGVGISLLGMYWFYKMHGEYSKRGINAAKKRLENKRIEEHNSHVCELPK